MTTNDEHPQSTPGPAPHGQDGHHGYYGPPGPTQGPAQSSHAATDRFFDSIRRTGLVRTEDRWFGGVAGGLGRKFGVDPLLVRGTWAVSLLIAGAGLVLYAIGWALLPEERDGRIHAQEMLRGHFDVALIGAGAILIAGFGWGGVATSVFFPGGGWLRGLLWLASSAVVVGVVILLFNQNRHTWHWGPPGSPDGGSSAGPYTTPTPGSGPSGSSGPSPYAQPTSPYASAARAGNPAGPASGNPEPPSDTGPRPYAGPSSFAGTPSYTGSTPSDSPPFVPVPPKRRPRGAGASLTGAILGVWILTLAGLLLAHRAGELTMSVTLLSLGILVVLCGVGIMISGLRGRRAGGLGTIAILAAILAFPAGGWVMTGVDISQASRAGFGEATFQPTSITSAEKGFAMLAGDWQLDLRDLPAHNDPVEIPVSMAAGQLVINIPANTPWVADFQAAAGAIEIDTPSTTMTKGGLLNPIRTFESDLVAQGATPSLDLTIRAVAGHVIIIEEQP